MTAVTDTTLHAVFAGPRGRLLAGLLFAEFGTAVQAVAEAAVLPLASRELRGAALFGATIAAPTFASILFIVLGPAITARLGPRGALGISTVAYVLGVLLAALAPAMGFVLAGRLVQGAAAGLLAGFGLGALGALYEDAVRPRVLGLFSAIWLLPSVVGPVLNAWVAVLAGWRWSMAWPAIVVLAARVVIGRTVTLLPLPSGTDRRPPLGPGIAVLAALGVASLAPALSGAARPVAWFGGLLAAVLAAGVLMRSLVGGGRRALLVGVFAALCCAYFGGEGLLSLGVISVTGNGVIGASLAYAAGATAWSLTGLSLIGTRVKRWAPVLGGAAIAAGLAVLAAVMLPGATGGGALVAAVVAWAVAGLGIGLSYRMLSAAAFDESPAADAPGIGAAVAFADALAVAIGALVGGGFYSLTADLLPPETGVGLGYVLVTAIAVAAVIAALVLAGRRTVGAAAAADLG